MHAAILMKLSVSLITHVPKWTTKHTNWVIPCTLMPMVDLITWGGYSSCMNSLTIASGSGFSGSFEPGIRLDSRPQSGFSQSATIPMIWATIRHTPHFTNYGPEDVAADSSSEVCTVESIEEATSVIPPSELNSAKKKGKSPGPEKIPENGPELSLLDLYSG